MVGVANDAVNFLNSALGSKVAPRKWIFIIASLGIVVGVTFSSGLMEVARKGIFDPSFFLLPEIMFIFLAVMITDVLLLDFFNTFGLPTSTTVSIVFELLGAALAIAALKMVSAGEPFFDAFIAINAPGVLKIISGIILSIVIAFTVGAIIQYLTRMLFTFDYKVNMRKYGALWGGVALTAITFFIILKGAKGASFISDEASAWILNNVWLIALISMGFWAVVLQILMMTVKINVFKPIVLVGTFALAMAFAANDLVNFIGAPLAGLKAYVIGAASDDPMNLTMGALAEKVKANTWYLLIAGVIMVVTLWLNKKARSVTKTEINLGRQSAGVERFESIAPARGIVRAVLIVFDFISRITPKEIRDAVSRRFDNSRAILPVNDEDGETPAFDLVRAAVNLMVAAVLISIGTTMKLPLSTTYVTFTVAMATALPDRAWGRDSAVYRVSGVLTVFGGWFFTALLASFTAAIVALIIFYGQLPAIIGLLILAAFTLYRSTIYHTKREKELEDQPAAIIFDTDQHEQAKQFLRESMARYIKRSQEVFESNTKGLATENLGLLRKARKDAKSLHRGARTMTQTIVHTSSVKSAEQIEEDRALALAIRALQNLARSVQNLASQVFEHVDNLYDEFDDEAIEEMKELDQKLREVLSMANDLLIGKTDETIPEMEEKAAKLKKLCRKLDKRHLKRLRKQTAHSRADLLFFEIISDTATILDNTLLMLHVLEQYRKQAPYLEDEDEDEEVEAEQKESKK